MSPAQALLDRIRIASPCPADWASMSGDDRARFCAQCGKHVYDVSAMTAEETLVLIREKEGRLCVRLWQRADGTVITADCPVGVLKLRRRSRIAASMAAASLLALAIDCARPQVRPAPGSLPAQAFRPAPPTRFGFENGLPTATVEVVAAAPITGTATMGLMISQDWSLVAEVPEGPTQGRIYGQEAMAHLPLR